MAESVYLLCALASAACAIMLLRAYHRTRARLLLWSALCFAALTANNILLVVDLVVFPAIDLSTWRSAAALAGLLIMLYGLVWEAE